MMEKSRCTVSVSDIVSDFFISQPSLEVMSTYRLPDKVQVYAQELLAKNREGTLTEQERDDLVQLRQMDHLLTLVKAKAKLKLKAANV